MTSATGVKPGEPLVELDPVDARLGVQQAESKYLGELVKLGITRQQAEDFVKKYGISEELLIGQVADEAIAKAPSVIQKRLAREKRPCSICPVSVRSPSAARARRRSSTTPRTTGRPPPPTTTSAVQIGSHRHRQRHRRPRSPRTRPSKRSKT